jgi:hypothetical protein
VSICAPAQSLAKPSSSHTERVGIGKKALLPRSGEAGLLDCNGRYPSTIHCNFRRDVHPKKRARAVRARSFILRPAPAAPEPSPKKSLSEATSCACVMPYHRRGAACDTFAPRHIERSDAPKPTVRRGSWGKPSWSAVHPKSNDWDRALKRFIGCAPRRERKAFRPSGECAWCQAGYVNDRGHGRRLGLSAPRAFPSSALSGRRSCRWRWGGLEKRSQRRQSRPD